MTDKEALQIGLLRNGKTKNIAVTAKFLSNHKEFKEYLENRYTDIPEGLFSYKEVLWRIKYKIESRPKCANCGAPVKFIGKESWDKIGKTKNGYLTFCCTKCSNGNENVKAKVKNTVFKKYGTKSLIENSDVREKFNKTMMLKYGVKNALKNNTLLEKARKTTKKHYGVTSAAKSEVVKDKMKKTNIEKYGGVAPACNTDVLTKMQRTTTEKYGADSYFKTEMFAKLRNRDKEVWAEKGKKTAILNGTINTSKSEKRLKEFLILIFGEDNVISQYKTKEYPYFCDFYLKKEGIYIEYNGTYFHNKCLFNENRDYEKYNKLLDKCNNEHPSYERILYVWTKLDVKKHNIAIENDLNFIFLYPNWNKEWKKYLMGKKNYSIDNIITELKKIIENQVKNKSVKIIGEEYD